MFGALTPYLIPSSLELINGEARAATMSSGTSSTGASRPPITEFSAAKDAPNLVEAQEWLRIGPTPVGNACGPGTPVALRWPHFDPRVSLIVFLPS